MTASTDSAEALLGFARQYHRAAIALIPLVKEVEAPLYHAFAHAVELALKAFVRTRAPSVDMTHDLADLHQEARKLGFPDDHRLTNVVNLLQQETEVHGFRYYVHKTLGRPSLDNLCEIVDPLMAFVAREVAAHPTRGGNSRGVLKITVGIEGPKEPKKATPAAWGGHEPRVPT